MQESTKLVPTFVFIISKSTTVQHLSVRYSVHLHTIKMDRTFEETYKIIWNMCINYIYKKNGSEEAQFPAI